MQIDWFTLVAQIINFLILLWLLQRFLYGPILRTMQAREDKLTAQFAAAEEKSKTAEAERSALRAERDELAERREELLQTARAEAAERRKHMLQEARQEADAHMTRWYDAIDREKQAFLREVQTRMGQQVLDLVRRALADLAGLELEKAVVRVFIERVRRELENSEDADNPAESTSTANHSAAASGNGAGQAIVVRTSFELPEDLEQAVRDALAPLTETRAAGRAVQIKFEQTDDLICGIEAEIRRRRIAWSIRDYLERLESDLDDAILQNGLAQAQRRREANGDNGVDEILPG